MAASTGSLAGGAIPGLSLRAWALIVAGAFVKGSNVASWTRNAAGDYTMTYTAAMPDANAMVVGQVQPGNGQGLITLSTVGTTTTQCAMRTYKQSDLATPIDATFWVGVYG